jgi:hypothetical protein
MLFLPVQVMLFLPSHRIFFLIFAFIVSTPFYLSFIPTFLLVPPSGSFSLFHFHSVYPVHITDFLPVHVIDFLPSHRIFFLIFAFIVSTPFSSPIDPFLRFNCALSGGFLIFHFRSA